MSNHGPSAELLQLLENLPPDEPRSKLEPFRAIILRWRRQGRSYRRIQEILLEQCQLAVAYETLRRFVQRRERPRAALPEDEAPITPSAPPLVPTAAAASVDPYAEARERMRRFKAEPVPVKPVTKPFFEVSDDDFIKPLVMMPKK
jgi:hypothetical protein